MKLIRHWECCVHLVISPSPAGRTSMESVPIRRMDTFAYKKRASTALSTTPRSTHANHTHILYFSSNNGWSRSRSLPADAPDFSNPARSWQPLPYLWRRTIRVCSSLSLPSRMLTTTCSSGGQFGGQGQYPSSTESNSVTQSSQRQEAYRSSTSRREEAHESFERTSRAMEEYRTRTITTLTLADDCQLELDGSILAITPRSPDIKFNSTDLNLDEHVGNIGGELV
ncbi:hypothetical protein FB451DRAFT_443275 [Mycena latifolia]|nr:hypothetical protein FB451DRAFT_443275 [Mycena latifolia]